MAWRWTRGDARLCVAVGVTVAVFGGLLGVLLWLGIGVVESIKTAGIGAGSIVALYALWLNDRRRQVEEGRHEHDQQRVADERFAKAVELLGHEADQVRVGALHALAGLARSRPEHTQTVLDVLCAYLRRPFTHPRYEVEYDAVGRYDRELITGTDDQERELQVRLTATRLLRDLLPEASTDATCHDLDLTGARLEYLDLTKRAIGTLTLRYATLHSTTRLNGCHIRDAAWFTRTRFGQGRLGGQLLCQGARFGRAWFPGAVFEGPVHFDRSRFDGPTLFDGVVFREEPSFADVVFARPPSAEIAALAARSSEPVPAESDDRAEIS